MPLMRATPVFKWEASLAWYMNQFMKILAETPCISNISEIAKRKDFLMKICWNKGFAIFRVLILVLKIEDVFSNFWFWAYLD